MPSAARDLLGHRHQMALVVEELVDAARELRRAVELGLRTAQIHEQEPVLGRVEKRRSRRKPDDVRLFDFDRGAIGFVARRPRKVRTLVVQEARLELLSSIPNWLAYEYPEEVRSQKGRRGQVQKWFLFRFKGLDQEITLGDQKEFKAWKWTTMHELFPKVVPFKQPVYQELVEYFKEYLKSP